MYRYIIRIDGKLLEIEKKTIFLDEKKSWWNFFNFRMPKNDDEQMYFYFKFFLPKYKYFHSKLPVSLIEQTDFNGIDVRIFSLFV